LELEPACVVADVADGLEDVEELIVAAQVAQGVGVRVRIVESATLWRAASSVSVIASE
jgi:hypothetical protein